MTKFKSILVAVLLQPLFVFSQPIPDILTPSTEAHLTGYLGDQLNGSIKNRILAQDYQRLINPFKAENRTEARMWQSEFWGKWFTSAALAYKYQPDPELRKILDQAVAGLMATQTSDGYIGNYAPDHRLEQWDVWGRKYCMLGLLSYYELFKDKKSLNAATRLADNLIDDLTKADGIIVTKGNYRGMAASSVLEPVCILYRHTNNKKYLDFALEIVRQWETPVGPQLISKANTNVSERFPKPVNWYSPEQGQKAYEMMSCYEGLLELYRITGDAKYRKAVEDTWTIIRDTEINIAGSGASAEMWFSGKAIQNLPIHHYQEVCVTVTWIKLSEQLLRLTGEAKYADEVERAYYNALLSSMSHEGAIWAKYTPLNGQRLAGSEQCGMGLNCCEASGPRGLFAIPMHFVMSKKDGIQVNYFSGGTFKVKSPKGSDVTISQRTTYPAMGSIDIEVSIEKQEAMEIAVRVPAWSEVTSVQVNGEAVNDIKPGDYTRINRTWKNGDKVSVEFDMRGRIVDVGTSLRSIAIMRGPIVLARDSRFEGVDIEAVVKPITIDKKYVDLVPSVSHKEGNMIFEAMFIPESYMEEPRNPLKVILCDYASAGNSAVNSYYKVWLPQLVNPRDEK